MLLFSCSVVTNSLRLQGLRCTRLPYPSSFPRACSNSYPLSQWCHLTISSSVLPFFSCLQSFLASGSFFFFLTLQYRIGFAIYQQESATSIHVLPILFLMSRLLSGGQSIRASASASVLPMNIQDFLYDWLVWSPCNPRDSQESSPTQ